MTMTAALSFLGAMRPAFLAHLADRLNEEICSETAALAEEWGVAAPVRTHSALLYLAEIGPATLADIAAADGQSHQLVTQRLAPLEAMGLIERFHDAEDGRRKPYRLTARGRREAARVAAMAEALSGAMESLFEETGVNLAVAIDKAREGLQRIPLAERMIGGVQKKRSFRK